MCDQDHLAEMDTRPRGVSRRELGALGAMAALAACGVSEEVQAQGGLTEADVSFDAPGGTLDGFFVHPASGKSPAVILWPDIAGAEPPSLDDDRVLGIDTGLQTRLRRGVERAARRDGCEHDEQKVHDRQLLIEI